MRFKRLFFFAIATTAILVGPGCGIRGYPGQPGVVTDQFSKLSEEMLDESGLFFYETTYDNRPGGKGVQSVVTKLYPGARTFTSNIRTNSDGSKYQVKGEYKGAVVQMISLPPTHEVILPPGSKVQVIVDYSLSMDEIDVRNASEESLFSGALARGLKPMTSLSQSALKSMGTRLSLFRAGRLDRLGSLNYQVTAVDLNGQIYTPAKPILVQTDLTQAGVRTSLTEAEKQAFVSFLESRFPKGYQGEIRFQLAGSSEPISYPVRLNTPKTLSAAGTHVTLNASAEQIRQALAKGARR
jgi:hypothetical protein